MNKRRIAILPRQAMTSAVWLLMIFIRPLEVLLCGLDDDLIDVHPGWLLDGVSDRTSDRVGRNRYFVELAQILSGVFLRTAFRKLGSNRARRDYGASNIVGLVFHAQALGYRADSEFGCAVYGPAGGPDLEAPDGRHVDDVALFLLLHDRQHRGHPVQEALDVYIDHAVPLFDLERRHRRDGHDPGIVDDHVDSAVLTDCSLD